VISLNLENITMSNGSSPSPTAGQWQLEKEFKDEASSIVVRLQKKTGFRPVYSIQISRVRDDGRPVPFLPIFIESRNGSVVAVRDNSQVIDALIRSASAYAREAAERREAEILDAKISKEEADLKRGQNKAPKGLKTLGKMDAAKRTSNEDPNGGRGVG
jgi:hypothetical protein